MARIVASEVQITVTAQELALLVRALKCYVTYESDAAEDVIIRSLIEDLSTGGAANG